MIQGFRTASIILLAASIAGPAFAQGPGADIYKTATPKCGMCHGADGLGATPAGKAMKAASFKDPAVVSTPDAAMIAIVKSGKNKMPAYGDKLSGDQIKAVVAYIRTLQK